MSSSAASVWKGKTRPAVFVHSHLLAWGWTLKTRAPARDGSRTMAVSAESSARSAVTGMSVVVEWAVSAGGDGGELRDNLPTGGSWTTSRWCVVATSRDGFGQGLSRLDDGYGYGSGIEEKPWTRAAERASGEDIGPDCLLLLSPY